MKEDPKENTMENRKSTTSFKELNLPGKPDETGLDRLLAHEISSNPMKIVVLDDDPTGVQTVHDVSVYTDWSEESIRAGFAEDNKVFYILTNSRGMTEAGTAAVHRDIAARTAKVSRDTGIPYMYMSRSDSTLRGHYPLETEILREGIEATGGRIDGEIICPFFKEGGRFTIGNVHYVLQGEEFIPAAETEFAKDRTFGYTKSSIPEYIEEKTKGSCAACDVTCISIDDLRTAGNEINGMSESSGTIGSINGTESSGSIDRTVSNGSIEVSDKIDSPCKIKSAGKIGSIEDTGKTECAGKLSSIEKITAQLMAVEGFGKVCLNAADYCDLKVFAIALYRAMAKGKRFLFRTAAGAVKVMGGISDRPLLTRSEMISRETGSGGVIVVGSHTEKTTAQLKELLSLESVEPVEFNSDKVLEGDESFYAEVDRCVVEEERIISSGRTAVCYTRRKLLTVEGDTGETALQRSVRISDGVQSLVGRLKITPAFVIAKGGITSSDIGTKALGVKRADVMGQIRPGIPVWQTGPESRFPGIPYVIFPGNTGGETTLREAAEMLM